MPAYTGVYHIETPIYTLCSPQRGHPFGHVQTHSSARSHNDIIFHSVHDNCLSEGKYNNIFPQTSGLEIFF